MRKAFSRLVVVVAVVSLHAAAFAKDVARPPVKAHSSPTRAALPPDLMAQGGGPLRTSAATDTFVLHSADFDNGGPNPMGYISVDVTAQEPYSHVAGASELDGGTHGNLLPLAGAQSMWCGVDATTTEPFCGYATLPGYGNGWVQTIVTSAIPGDSVFLTYKAFWDSEPGYDATAVEHSFDGGQTWTEFIIDDFGGSLSNVYDGTAPTPFFIDSVSASDSGASSVLVRFLFQSDGAWSDEDGIWPTDGAILLDDISIQTWTDGSPNFSDLEDFESVPAGSQTAGIWSTDASNIPGFGDFAALYPGVSVLQEDPCFFDLLFLWGFFDDPLSTAYICHTPNPLPGQGAVPFGNADGLYIHNEIWSPQIPNTGSGDAYELRFRVYRDLPLNNGLFFIWGVRSWKDNCPGRWRDSNFVFYGAGRDWLHATFQIGSLADADADAFQISLGVIDMCGVWCNVFVSGACHSQGPLFDDVELLRIDRLGPQFAVRHIELFQDNFADDGTLTGTARADAAIDILPSYSPGILPGDSVAMTIAPVGPDAGGGPAAYLYVRVQNSNDPKSGASLASTDTRPGVSGPRWPHKGSVTIGGDTWEIIRMDSTTTSQGFIMADRYCVDLNDALFVPGDTIHYFFCADADNTPSSGNEVYWHRTFDGQGVDNETSDIDEAATSPCEFTILPAGGYNRGGDVLYVDDADDRAGPVQFFFDDAFQYLPDVYDQHDRYDVLGPSSAVGNSLESRVKNRPTQIVDVYRTILWSSGNLSSATIGDGTGSPEKSNDFALLEQFIRTSNKDPNLFISGDDIAEEWGQLAGAEAFLLRSTWIPFSLIDGSHINAGEAVSPTLTAAVGSYFHSGILGPDVLIAYGGCSLINDFDVLSPTGHSREEFPYPISLGSAVISSETTNTASTTARIILSGFSFDYIRTASQQVVFPGARVNHMRKILQAFNYNPPLIDGVDPGAVPSLVNALHAAYPNPFNPTTTIEYSIREPGHVSLKVYNVAGQLVRTLVDDVLSPDRVAPVRWDGLNDAGQAVSSGVYFYRMVTKQFSQTRKMVLLK